MAPTDEGDNRKVLPPIVTVIIMLGCAIPTLGTCFWAMGAWDVRNDQLDGALIAASLLFGVVGAALTLAYSKVG